VDRLEAAIHGYDDNLTTGTPFTNTLLLELCRRGKQDLAYHLAMKPEYPSFRFMLGQGTTAMWERFDSWLPALGYNPSPMNGLIHVGFCSVAEWVYASCSGIRPDGEKPGFARFHLSPCIYDALSEMRSAYDSVRGTIVSEWAKKDGRLDYHVIVPPNTTATVTLASTDPARITESGIPAVEAAGVKPIRRERSCAVYHLDSGEYRFSAAWAGGGEGRGGRRTHGDATKGPCQ
jgi:alpha-L-rhamnosidase